jgi:superfamily II DNA or RNA helicase
MQLRPYQQQSIENIQEEWKRVRSTLLVLPTGCGKTIVFCKLSELKVRNGDRILILAHREELLMQAADKMEKSTGLHCAIEKAEHTALGSWFRITVGSVQTLKNPKRHERFSPDYYNYIIIDEAHHALSPTYISVINYFSGAQILGVTATPDRGDKKNLGKVFQSIAFEYTLPEAIRDGFLSPIKALTLPLDIDLGKLSIKAGDFSEREIDNALNPYLESIADEMINHCMDRKSMVFLPLIATSKKMQMLLNERGFRCAEVNGKSKDRKEIIKDFGTDKYNVICNSMLLTEGFDEPSVDCIVCLRPTKVRALYSQIIGRGTRLSPETGKTDLLVLDFLWHTEKHELCRPAHLISHDKFEAEAMVKIMEKNSKSGNPQALDLEEVEDEAKKDAVKERENALAKELREKEGRKKKLVDPVAFGLSIDSADLKNYAPTEVYEMGLPSKQQMALLERHGINPDEITCFGYASKVIQKLQARNSAGMSTPKQIRFLKKYGFKNVQNWTQDQASKMFTRIKKNHWNVPTSVDPKAFIPETPDSNPNKDWMKSF